MRAEEFDYTFPPELIAQRPLAERDAARMLVIDRKSGQFEDRTFREISQLLSPHDLLVLNNTRVFPARLLGRRKGVAAQPLGKNNPARREFLTGTVELLLIRQESAGVWEGLVHPGRKVRPGEVLVFGEGELEAEILDRGEYGRRRARLRARQGTIEEAIDRLGHVPLPPYIRRPDEPSDRAAYQTVYARERGAVAAPTAGLHFTPQALAALRARAVETCEITLHAGLGTFEPVRVHDIETHRMDAERYEVSPQAAAAINRALEERRRIIAVGTTTVRALESAADAGRRVRPGSGDTSLFIYPGYEFRIPGALLTNFHLPRSTLLMLVCAFAGRELTLRAYGHAVRARYRFYSYGDCMLVV